MIEECFCVAKFERVSHRFHVVYQYGGLGSLGHLFTRETVAPQLQVVEEPLQSE